MKPTIEEQKQSELTRLLDHLEEGLSNFEAEFDNEALIPDDQMEIYKKVFNDLGKIVSDLKDEVYYS